MKKFSILVAFILAVIIASVGISVAADTSKTSAPDQSVWVTVTNTGKVNYCRFEFISDELGIIILTPSIQPGQSVTIGSNSYFAAHPSATKNRWLTEMFPTTANPNNPWNPTAAKAILFNGRADYNATSNFFDYQSSGGLILALGVPGANVKDYTDIPTAQTILIDADTGECRVSL